MSVTLQLLLFTLCVAGSSFFAGSETGFVSWNPLKVGHRAAKGDIVARWALFLIRHKDRLLSAQLIGNNICIVGASLTFVSLFATIDHHLRWNLSELPSPESWLLTPLMVLFGEMLPKSLFRLYPFRLTMRSVPLLLGIYFVTLPFTWIFTTVTGLFKRNNPARGESFMTKVREEMVSVATEGSRSGTLFRSADLFIQNVLAMNEKRIGDLFTGWKSAARPPENSCFDGNISAGTVKRRVRGGNGILVRGENGTIRGYITMGELVALPDTVTIASVCRPVPRLEATTAFSAAFRLLDVEVPFVKIVDGPETELAVVTTDALLQGALGGG